MAHLTHLAALFFTFLQILPLVTAIFSPCNRTDSLPSCPYGGKCNDPTESTSCYAMTLTPNAPVGFCPASCSRFIEDWGNGIHSTGITRYSTTLENGTRIFNPWDCSSRSDIYDTNCTSGFACRRRWTVAPPVCSPLYTSCGSDGTGCAEGEKCVTDPRVNLFGDTPARYICIPGNATCKMDLEKNGPGGDEGRTDCSLFGKCVAGACMTMIDCTKSAYGCPGTGTGFNYNDGY